MEDVTDHRDLTVQTTADEVQLEHEDGGHYQQSWYTQWSISTASDVTGTRY